jgi:hypothetical protein
MNRPGSVRHWLILRYLTAATLAAAAFPCAVRFSQARDLERILTASACGEGQIGHAMAFGSCSHCWAVAFATLTIAALLTIGRPAIAAAAH